MKTRGARARWAASPEGIAEAERLAAEEKAELDREAAAAAAAAPELTRLFPAHDDAAKKKSKKKAPSRGVGLPDPLFRRVVMFWLG